MSIRLVDQWIKSVMRLSKYRTVQCPPTSTIFLLFGIQPMNYYSTTSGLPKALYGCIIHTMYYILAKYGFYFCMEQVIASTSVVYFSIETLYGEELHSLFLDWVKKLLAIHFHTFDEIVTQWARANPTHASC